MKACNEVFLGRDGNSPEALHHLSQAFSEVQKRLNGPDALKDSTLTIILMLVLQQQLLGDHTGAKVHVEGLRRMVELRGGVDALQPNLPLVLKICK
jgi:hypothetical protein